MGSKVSAESWEGEWRNCSVPSESCTENVGIERIRIGASPSRLTLEVHNARTETQHALLCSDLGPDWQDAPDDAIILAELAGEAASSFKRGAKLAWRNHWADESMSCLITELRNASTEEVIVIERRLPSENSMTKNILVRKGETASSSVSCDMRKEISGTGPAPVTFLRQHGRSLKTLEERKNVLDKVGQLILENMDAISDAHETDRVVPAKFDGTGRMILGGIASYKDLLPKWMEPESIPDAAPPPVKAGVETVWSVHNEPLGVCINIAPWNAPVTLCLIPALAMLAAGNHVVIKPPDLVPNISALLRRLCQKYLAGYVWVEEGDKDTVNRIIDEGADHLEFTGGAEIAKIIAARCARVLTPVTLELGGKSPCFVDKGLSDAMLDNAIREILETKVYKTGQFCCAHDYALVHEEVHADFCARFKAKLEELGPKRKILMIGRRQYEEIKRKLKDSEAECIPPLAGDMVPDDQSMTVPMTGLLQPSLDKKVLTEEIFGPLLPILKVKSVQEAVDIINRPVSAKPLIAYCYTKDQTAEEYFVGSVPAGNIAVNGGPQRMIGNYASSFGGVGPSGTGVGFWGRDALAEFSNRKKVMRAKEGFAKSFFSGPPPPQ